MRLKARVNLTYAGKEWSPGQLFDAPQQHAQELINSDRAERFLLEDPSQRTLAEALDNLLPDLPAVPPVTITPASDEIPAAGGSGRFDVEVTGPGVSRTWTAEKDPGTDWLTIDAPTTPQTASGTVDYTVAANTDAERTANIHVNGSTFVVTQLAGVEKKKKKYE